MHSRVNIAYCGIFGALALTLPMMFHVLGLAGVTFLPMYWPIVTLAFLVPVRYAVPVAAFIPLVSMCLTGMPLAPVAPVISLELSIQAALIGIFRNLVEKKTGFLSVRAAAWHNGRAIAPRSGMANDRTSLGAGGAFLILAFVLIFGRFLHTALIWLLLQMFPNVRGVPHVALTWLVFLTGWPGVLAMLAFVPVFVGSVTHRDGVCEVRFLKALRRMHLPEKLVLLSAQVLRLFESLTRDAEMMARAIALRTGTVPDKLCTMHDKLCTKKTGTVPDKLCTMHDKLCTKKTGTVPALLVRVRKLGVRYPGASGVALTVDEMDVKAGERVALIGANGSGKTTFLSVLSGFVDYDGEVEVCGIEPKGNGVKAVHRRIGVLFENPDDQFIYPTVREDVGHALEGRGLKREEIDARVDELLTSLGLETGNRPIASLSRGQRQRVAIAGVLAGEPELLLLDEPTAALDSEEKMRLAGILKSLPSAIIIATHDLSFASSVCTIQHTFHPVFVS